MIGVTTRHLPTGYIRYIEQTITPQLTMKLSPINSELLELKTMLAGKQHCRTWLQIAHAQLKSLATFSGKFSVSDINSKGKFIVADPDTNGKFWYLVFGESGSKFPQERVLHPRERAANIVDTLRYI